MAEGQEKSKKETERNGHSLFTHLFGDLEGGWATLWMKREDGSKETVWFDLKEKSSLEAMMERAISEDEAGSDVYFSTCPGRAARGPMERVKASDVAFVPAFFMDVDTRRGSKAVADVPESVEAAMAGLKCLPFPPTAAVCSGNGVHAYWRLDGPVKADSPEALAKLTRQMKGFALTVAREMGYDDLDVSASEPARVLRVPGTHNRKDEPLPVELLQLKDTAYPLDTLARWAGCAERTLQQASMNVIQNENSGKDWVKGGTPLSGATEPAAASGGYRQAEESIEASGTSAFRARSSATTEIAESGDGIPRSSSGPEDPSLSQNAVDTLTLPDVIPEGSRNTSLFRHGCSLRVRGADDAEVKGALLTLNRERCRPPLEEAEVRGIVRSVTAKPKGNPEPGDFPDSLVVLERDGKGNALCTVDNFLRIMREDPHYQPMYFNLLSYRPEVRRENGRPRPWNDADRAISLCHIEKEYGLFSQIKHDSAQRIMFGERTFHPLQEIVDGLVWDGQPRIEGFLAKWMKTGDSAYAREVSRLLFAGGIHRLYHPGCKFDNMVVLIGRSQGEGKSTIARFLAIKDEFFAEAKTVEGKESVEQLSGLWIAEMDEMRAVSLAREVESVKSYLSRLVDRYRVPFDIFPSERPRSCVFIGTTNDPYFLTDKSGNRRFFPIEVHSSGREVFRREAEVRAEVLQCWAEAKVRMEAGTLPPVENFELMEEIQKAQNASLQDDWREGAVQAYLEKQTVGAKVCVQELRKYALHPGDDHLKDDRAESRVLRVLMDKAVGWKELPVKTRSSKMYDAGPQRCWEKQNAFIVVDDSDVFP